MKLIAIRPSYCSRPRTRVRVRSLSWLAMAISLVGLVLPATSASSQEEPAPLVLILDASGSMWGQVDGENKIVIARRVLGELIDELPDASEVGLVAYGHRRKGDCADIETLIPLGPLDRAAVKSAVEGLNPKGKTPITASVEQALEIVRKSGEPATVLLLSDGLETCGGDPCRAVQTARDAGAPLLLHVVGFDVEGEDLSQLQCMAQAGGGLFLNAEDASELGAALDAAVALSVDAPAGRLVVHAIADGELQDVAIHVVDEQGQDAGGARTYDREKTNPSSIPLSDGRYDVTVRAVGMKGDLERTFEIEIAEGSTVEKTVDFSTGELRIGVKRNGALSDAVYKVYAAGTNEEMASGRTYTSETRNPAKVRLTTGRYDVKVHILEVANKPWIELGTVEVEPRGQHEAHHAFESGSLAIGALRGTERTDALVYVIDAANGKSVAQARTYTGPSSNPKVFELLPGRYLVRSRTVGKNGIEKETEVAIEAAGQVTHDFDFDG